MSLKPFRVKRQKPCQTEVMPQRMLLKCFQQPELLEQGRRGLVPGGKTFLPTRSPLPADFTGNGALTVPSRDHETPSAITVPLSHSFTGDTKMKITFTDPMTSGCLVAEVSPSKTASDCIQTMKQQNFLGVGTYMLTANGKVMLPDQTFADAGVTEGGTVAIQKMEQGA